MQQTAITVQDIPLAQLRESKHNPRKHFDPVKLEELAASIREKGVIEPLIVRKNGSGFELVAGARRYRASKLAGQDTAPCIVRELSDLQALEHAVVENQQREDVGPIEEAEGYAALMKAEKAYTVAVVAAKVGKSESYVYRRLKLLQLEPWLQDALAEDRLTVAHAEKLLRLPAALRKEADDRSLIWHYSPLWRDDEKPGKDDLAPLHGLEAFIRERTAFRPDAEETKHYQPELQEQIVGALAEDGTLPDGAGLSDQDADAAVEAAKSELIELSADPMCRAKLRVGKSERIPLTPSRWKEVTSAKQRCAFTVRGVIVHGGPPRILDVCTAKGKCAKHWPAKKKAKTSAAAKAKTQQDSWQEQERKRREREEAVRREFEAILAHARPELAKHTAGMQLSAALVRGVLLHSQSIRNVEDRFGVALTDATAAQVLALAQVESHWRPNFERDCKMLGFNLKPIIEKVKAEQKAAAKATAKADRAAKKKPSVGSLDRPGLAPSDPVDAAVWHAMGHIEGGRQRFDKAVSEFCSDADLDRLIRDEFGTGGYAGDDMTYDRKAGALVIREPVKRKLTVGKVRRIIRRLLGAEGEPTKASARKKAAKKR